MFVHIYIYEYVYPLSMNMAVFISIISNKMIDWDSDWNWNYGYDDRCPKILNLFNKLFIRFSPAIRCVCMCICIRFNSFWKSLTFWGWHSLKGFQWKFTCSNVIKKFSRNYIQLTVWKLLRSWLWEVRLNCSIVQ